MRHGFWFTWLPSQMFYCVTAILIYFIPINYEYKVILVI